MENQSSPPHSSSEAAAPAPAMPQSFTGRKVLVTGARGFIGSRLCARLAADRADVCGVSRGALPFAGVRGVQLDLSDAREAGALVRDFRPEFIFHLAGYVQGARGLENVRPAFEGNLMTTVNLLTLAAELGCQRIVLTGSQDEPNVNEVSAAQFVPPSPYAAAKYAGNTYARMFHELYQLPVTIGRIFMAYGPGQLDLKKLIPYVILCLLRGESPKLSTGSRPMDWIYVDDVVDALMRMAQCPAADGKTVELGTGVPYTARQAACMLVDLMKAPLAPAFGAVADRKLEAPRFANTEATRSLLNWQAAVPFEDGLLRTIEWYSAEVKSGRIRA